MAADPRLVEIWTRAWSRTRGLAAPVLDGGAWRIEVGAPDQLRRFVFADLTPEVRALAARIVEPGVMIKVCAEPSALADVLPSRWSLRPAGFLMASTFPMSDAPDLPGLEQDVQTVAGVVRCRFLGPDGAVAAQGNAVRVDDRVIYDRIRVGESFRRRGLGRRMMCALQAAAGPDLPGVLVATREGRALYRSLGWSDLSSYSTAVIEA